MSSYISSWFGSSASGKPARQENPDEIDARGEVNEDEDAYFDAVEQQTGEIERGSALLYEQLEDGDLT